MRDFASKPSPEIRRRLPILWLSAALAVELCIPAATLPAEELARPTIALSVAEQAWIKAHPRMRLGVDRTYQPISFIDDKNRYSGLAADYARLLESALGIQFEIVPLPASERLQAISAGRVDVLDSVGRTLERESFVNFTRAYATFPFAVVVRAGTPYISDLSDLSGKHVVVLEGRSVFDEIDASGLTLRVTTVPDQRAGYDMVARGEADASINNFAIAVDTLAESYAGRLKIGSVIPEHQQALSFAVRKDWPEFAAILDQALTAIPNETRRAARRI